VNVLPIHAREDAADPVLIPPLHPLQMRQDGFLLAAHTFSALIYGSNLANTTMVWTGNFPVSLGGVSVMIDNKPGYLWLVSPGQINLRAPDDTATGPVSVTVTTPNGTVSSTVILVAFGPSFSLLSAKYAAGVILTPNGSGAYGGGAYDLLGPSDAFSFNIRYRPAKRSN
jgi:uncharacterized protein (TIGR03437 family)